MIKTVTIKFSDGTVFVFDSSLDRFDYEIVNNVLIIHKTDWITGEHSDPLIVPIANLKYITIN